MNSNVNLEESVFEESLHIEKKIYEERKAIEARIRAKYLRKP